MRGQLTCQCLRPAHMQRSISLHWTPTTTSFWVLLCTAAPRSSLHTNSLSSASVVQLKIYALPISPSFSQFLQSWLNPSVNLGKFTLKPLTADHSRVTAYVVVLCGVRQKIPTFCSAVTVKHCCSANTAALTIPSSGEAQIFLSSFFLFCFFCDCISVQCLSHFFHLTFLKELL